jgi:glycosyltransferase involved in cell wall biosynthesis
MSAPALRLAIDVGPLYGHRTGVGVAVAGMVGALNERSDVALDPYLISFRTDPEPGHRRLPLPGIAASHLWSRADRPGADRWLPDCDVVHGTNYVAPPSRLPTVVSVYDCWFLEHPDLAVPIVRRAGRTLRRVVDRGGWVHTSSETTAARVGDLLDTDRVATVHLGPPAPIPESSDLAEPPAARDLAGRPFVVAIGTEERRKDLPLLVEAFARVTVDDAVLVLAGAAGDQTGEVGAAIEAQSGAVRDRIHRLGPVTEPAKHWLLRHASVLAYPSRDEGFGFPILEAQLAGTPVVARAVGAIPEVAGDGAELVRNDSAECLGDALDRVLTDGATRLRLLEAGHRNLHRFSWAATAAGLSDLYRAAQQSA